MTAADLTGLWRSQAHLLRFGADGTWAIDDEGRKKLESFPDDAGTFDVDGTTLTMVSSGKNLCGEGELWVWQIELTAPKKFAAVPERDDCMGEVGSEHRYTWARISP